MGGIRRQNSPRSGVTLLELLVVMAIAAILAGMAALSFAAIGRRSSREGAAQDIEGLLRRAQVSAVDSGRGALVRIDPVERSIYGLASTVEGAWHFEELDDNITPGAKLYDGSVPAGGGVTDGHDGVVGLCLQFDDSNDLVDCEYAGPVPVFNQTDGVRIEAWVWPGEVAGGSISATEVLGVMGKATGGPPALGFGMGVRCTSTSPWRYSVHGGFYLADGTQIALTGDGDCRIPGEEWSHVAIEFDGYEARLFVNGVLEDLDSYRRPETGNPVDDPGPTSGGGYTDVEFIPPLRIGTARGASLTVGAAVMPGSGMEYFQGLIDEPRLLSIAGGDRVQMPEGVGITASHETIRFDGQGRLDIAYHLGNVYVAVGDPYQAAELRSTLATGSSADIELRPRNPMLPAGGLVLIGREVIRYTGVNGDYLTGVTRERCGTVDPGYDYAPGVPVQFARVVEVKPSGVVARYASP